MAGPRKVRIFRDLKKSPNWYVEWRDSKGRRHCESCGPQEQDAEEYASRIREELRLQREEAKRLARLGRQDAPAGGTPTSASDCDGSAIQLQGVLRCAQLEVPITIRLEILPGLFTVLKQLLEGPGTDRAV